MKTYTVVKVEKRDIEPMTTEVKVFSNKNTAKAYLKNKIILTREASFNGISDDDITITQDNNRCEISAKYYNHIAEITLHENNVQGVTVEDLHKMMAKSELDIQFVSCDDYVAVIYTFSESSKYHGSSGRFYIGSFADSLSDILEKIAFNLK